MKKYWTLAFLGLFAWAFTACEPNEPDAKYPKKNLIEEFTGQGCGYCPYGMDCIHDFVGNDTNWIVVLHHYGYQADKFSVSGSKTITSALHVNGAPSMTINRASTSYRGGRGTVFHPGYLPDVNRAQFETSTYATIEIENTYDAESRELTIHVSGNIAKKKHPQLYLTVLVKESGMIDTQSDYYNTYEGWKEFRHTNAVRAFLTEPKGDEIQVNKHSYTADYELNLKAAWIPENCMVVAFLSEDFKPVVQAEQKPVISGTQGGADIEHGGITPVPVPDYYPEPDATKGPSDYSGNEIDTLTTAQAQYTPYSQYGYNYWNIGAYSTNVVTVNKTKCVRYASIYLYTALDQTTIPTGTYELSRNAQPGNAAAGFRDDSEMYIGGSEFYYTSQSYFNQGYLDPKAEWLIADGTLTVGDTCWELVGHARNGADIHLLGTTAIVNKGRAQQAPQKTPKKPSQLTEYCK